MEKPKKMQLFVSHNFSQFFYRLFLFGIKPKLLSTITIIIGGDEIP
jgi:hypothetical protein